MSSAVDLKTKEEKDAELDRKIEALRKKNEALVKRYQEIEEDKKRAEQEGIAITTPRKPRAHEPAHSDRRRTEKDNFTVTVDLSTSPAAGDKRAVDDRKPTAPRGRRASEEGDGPRGPSDGRGPPRRTGLCWAARGGTPREGGQERRAREARTPRDGEQSEAGGWRGGRRGRGGAGLAAGGGGSGGPCGGGGGDAGGTPAGVDRKSKEWEEKRRQNIEKMNEEMERIAEYERGQRADGDKPLRNFLDDPRRSGPAPDVDRKEGSRRHVRNWGGLDFDNIKTGGDLEREWTSRRPGPKGSMDMTMSMTGRERAEYLRWKKEREQIDEERLARHRNATGQWRREWDAQKTDNMFKEEANAAAVGSTPEQGGRRVRGRNFGSEPRGGASADDSKRPPKVPTFGDFLSQGRSRGPRGERSRGKGRGGKPSYSMHDNRWEGEKEDMEKEKKDKPKREKKSAPEPAQKAEPAEEDEQDDDQWEDASEGEEEVSDEDEKKDAGKEETGKDRGSPASPPPRSPPPSSARSPREQRTPRPDVRIPSPRAASQGLPEAGKPISPFQLLDGHQPVSDWGEEMEMLSPRSSVGGESPPKPPGAESSPPQKKEQEETAEATEEDAVAPGTTAAQSPPENTQVQQVVLATEPQCVLADGPDARPCLLAPSHVSDGTAPDAAEREQGAPDTPSQDGADRSPPAVLVSEAAEAESRSEAEGEMNDNPDSDDHKGEVETDAIATSEPSAGQPTSD